MVLILLVVVVHCSYEDVAFVGGGPFCCAILASPLVKEDKITKW